MTRAEIVRDLRRVADDQHRAGWDDEAGMYREAADMLEADGDREPCSIERMWNRRSVEEAPK